MTVDVREMAYWEIGKAFAGLALGGEEKSELLGDWLDSNEWEPHVPAFAVNPGEEYFCKGRLMLMVDRIGVIIYHNNGGRTWEKIGGIGYLSMGAFPWPPFDNSRRMLNLRAGTTHRTS